PGLYPALPGHGVDRCDRLQAARRGTSRRRAGVDCGGGGALHPRGGLFPAGGFGGGSHRGGRVLWLGGGVGGVWSVCVVCGQAGGRRGGGGGGGVGGGGAGGGRVETGGGRRGTGDGRRETGDGRRETRKFVIGPRKRESDRASASRIWGVPHLKYEFRVGDL